MTASVAQVIPPLLFRALKRLVIRARGDWALSPEGWTNVPGWDSPSVAEAQLERWTAATSELEGSGPIVPAHDDGMHNTLMVYGYVFGRAAHLRSRVRVLDWGGGLGFYQLVSATLFPEVELDYTCMDLPSIVSAGPRVQPNVRFTDSEQEALSGRYDLVLSSSSLHYSKEWKDVARKLAGVCDGFLYVTRLPVVESAASFVVKQRAYGTEYCGWFLNRTELIETFTSAGVVLEREFLIAEHPVVPGAPEDAHYRGFLFRAAASVAP